MLRGAFHLAVELHRPAADRCESGFWGLLFIGIHNAWDAVAYHAFVNMRKAKD